MSLGHETSQGAAAQDLQVVGVGADRQNTHLDTSGGYAMATL
jgi:hypothetical protein